MTHDVLGVYPALLPPVARLGRCNETDGSPKRVGCVGVPGTASWSPQLEYTSHAGVPYGRKPVYVGLRSAVSFSIDSSWVSNMDKTTLAAAFGDVDNDGDEDLVIGNFAAANQLYRRTPAGWSSSITLPGGNANTTSVALGDVNGDGFLDIIFGNYNEANELLLNTGIEEGDGTWTFRSSSISSGTTNGDYGSAQAAAQHYRGGSTSTTAIAFGDVDGDGSLDLIVGNDNHANQLLINNGRGGFRDDASFPGVPASCEDSCVSKYFDLRGDGVCDDGGPGSEWARCAWGTDSADCGRCGSSSTRAVALADVDSDGDLDLVIGHANNQSNELLLNTGSGSFSASFNTSFPVVGSNTTALVFGDVDGDGDVDLVIANGGGMGQRNELMLNDGVGGFSSDPTFPGGDADTHAVALGDVDGGAPLSSA